MQIFFGMILGALLLCCGVYVYDSMQTSAVANGEVTPDEAATIAGIIESRCRVFEHVELIGRIEALEALL